MLPERRFRHIAIIPYKDRSALRNEVVGGAGGKSLDGETRVRRTLRRQDRPIADEQVGDVVGAAEFVYDRGMRVGAHARGADQVSIARFLHHFCGAGGVHHLHRSSSLRH